MVKESVLIHCGMLNVLVVVLRCCTLSLLNRSQRPDRQKQPLKEKFILSVTIIDFLTKFTAFTEDSGHICSKLTLFAMVACQSIIYLPE